MEKRKLNENQDTLPTTVVEGGGKVVIYDSPEERDRLYDEIVADPDISGVVVFVPRERFGHPVPEQ